MTHTSKSNIPSVGSVMTALPHVVEISERLVRARVTMIEHDVRHLPVREGDKLVGVLTDRDIKRALDPDNGPLKKDELFVDDVYVPDAYVVDEADPLDVVLEEMAEQRIGSALVTKKDELVGILTSTDACRLLSEYLREVDHPSHG